MMTKAGHSGSPILKEVINEDGKITVEVVGIHTHRGIEERTGEGLLMSPEMRKAILNMVVGLLKEHNLTE